MRLYDERRVYIVLCAAVVLNCILLLSHTGSLESVLFRYAVRGFSLAPACLVVICPPVWVYVKEKLKTFPGLSDFDGLLGTSAALCGPPVKIRPVSSFSHLRTDTFQQKFEKTTGFLKP